MNYSVDDTIVARASAAGGSLAAIIRLSGLDTAAILGRCLASHEPDDPWLVGSVPVCRHGCLTLQPPFEPVACEVYFWPNHRSFTGQPSAEFHVAGSPPLVSAVIESLAARGARLARPGEFTMCAFLAGRLDLTQAEAVLSVVDATSELELSVALRQLAGGLNSELATIRSRLLDVLADLEAGLDFVEDDIDFITPEQLSGQLQLAAGDTQDLLDRLQIRSATVDQIRIVISGWTNVGKSSLFNCLVGESRALVADDRGTTRDYLLKLTDIQSMSAQLIDTAGVDRAPSAADSHPVESPVDSINRSAVNQSRNQVREAHIELFCLDSSRIPNAWEKKQLASAGNNRIVVATKSDLPAAFTLDPQWTLTSIHAPASIDMLRERICQQAEISPGSAGNMAGATALRCSQSLRLTLSAIQRARKIVQVGGGEEMVALEIRESLAHLGEITGAVYTDDILERIFSRFCIGK